MGPCLTLPTGSLTCVKLSTTLKVYTLDVVDRFTLLRLLRARVEARTHLRVPYP